ncbi:MAG TPA: SH3 domain-containing protein [Thermoanaerobaculia bacterium]|nr:SH3 domain-containing protein [Thermoanaerobaculia bacterium]
MRTTTAFLLLAVLACAKNEVATTETVDTRAAIEVLYVGAPTIDIHAKPEDAAKKIGMYQNGESVSVLAKQGEWIEIRFGDHSGWVRAADLVTPAERKEAEENPRPKFRVPPMPISAPSAKGEIYLEADVNTDGDVVAVRILSNTTGSDALAERNVVALEQAKFHPIVQKGTRQAFKYYHRISY